MASFIYFLFQSSALFFGPSNHNFALIFEIQIFSILSTYELLLHGRFFLKQTDIMAAKV